MSEVLYDEYAYEEALAWEAYCAAEEEELEYLEWLEWVAYQHRLDTEADWEEQVSEFTD